MNGKQREVALNTRNAVAERMARYDESHEEAMRCVAMSILADAKHMVNDNHPIVDVLNMVSQLLIDMGDAAFDHGVDEGYKDIAREVAEAYASRLWRELKHLDEYLQHLATTDLASVSTTNLLQVALMRQRVLHIALAPKQGK